MAQPLIKSVPKPARKCRSWIRSFIEYSQHINSPEAYLRWAAISTIAGAMRRRTYVRLQGEPVYPPLYMLLVGYPTSGKTRAIMRARSLLLRTQTPVAPAVVTKEMFLLRLGKTKKTTSDESKDISGWMEQEIDPEGLPVRSSAVTVMLDEFTTFLQKDDRHFMDILTALYDCPEKFDKETKTSGSDYLENVAVNVIGGTTYDRLAEILPDRAFGMGFASRLVLINSREKVRKPLFGDEYDAEESPEQRELRADLIADLQQISAMQGAFKFTPDGAKFLEAWYQESGKYVPPHPKLGSYMGRRHIHATKLAMVCSAAENSELLITLENVIEATETLALAEQKMPDALKEIDTQAEVPKFLESIIVLWRWTEKEGKMMAEYQFRQLLIQRIPANGITPLMDELIQSRWIEAVGQKPMRLLKPGPEALRHLLNKG